MIRDWPLLDERDGRAPAGYLRLRSRIYELPDGTTAEWDVVGEGGSVGVLALTPDRRVVLVRQFRPGPGRVLLELPGGGIDPGESPAAAAARELLEETGYAGEVEVVCDTWYGNAIAVQKWCAVALDVVPVAAPADDPHEPMETVLVTLEELRAHLRTGQLTDMDVAYRGLDHLGLL